MKQERVTTDHLIGTVLLGRYRIVRELAKGGMGVVYLARAEGAVGFVKPVVVKLVLPEHAEDERFVGMFAREARILAQLRHPSVVDVLEFGEENDSFVLVLEYVRGHHLGQWMRYLSLKSRSAPSEILIQIVIDVLDALHHAHNQRHPDGSPMQIVHRDVSPSNILLDDNGRGRLLDFGVARMRGGAHDYKTQVKGFMGKLPYTAPEIFAGNEATPQSDLYACAVVLHEVLFGRNVFRTESQAATLHTVMTHQPEALEPIRPVPAGLDAVLGKALAKNPVERFISAREFASALRKLQREQESDIRGRLAVLLKDDFSREMAAMLKIESLAERDDAWRRLSLRPPQVGKAEGEGGGATEMRSGSRARRITRDRFRDPGPSDGGTGSGSGERSPGLPKAPPAIDATVASRVTREPQTPGRLSLPQPLPAIAAPPPAAIPEPALGKIYPQRASAEAIPAAVENTASVSRRPPANQRMLWIAFGVTACLAIVAIVVSVQSRGAEPAAAPPSIRVVELAHDAPAVAPAPAQPAAPAPSEPAQVAAAQPSEPRATPGQRKPRGPDPRDLTRAFRQQQPKIEECFKQHALSLEGQPRLSLEFDLDPKGKLTHVQLVPAAVAGTALGKCLERVARATSFPAQGEPVSFAIPVTASRQ
jgi:serine/threonine protein kinase